MTRLRGLRPLLNTISPKWPYPNLTSPHLRRIASSPTIDNLEYPPPPTSNHHDLATFLAYVDRTSLDKESTIYLGTHYEYTVQIALHNLGMHLQRVGGHSDYGIDLLGTWSLPSVPSPLKVLIQCKALALSPIRPATVREMEGAFVGAPRGWRGTDVLGMLVSQKSATKGVREAMGRSRWPLAYALCGKEGRVEQMLWNRRAAEVGLEGVGVTVKYGIGKGRGKKGEIVLTWRGEEIER